MPVAPNFKSSPFICTAIRDNIAILSGPKQMYTVYRYYYLIFLNFNHESKILTQLNIDTSSFNVICK